MVRMADAVDRPWLARLTQLPTVAGHESRVIAFVRQWVAQRAGMTLETDAGGNLVVQADPAWTSRTSPPVMFTAHLDHPGFVVQAVVGRETVVVEFRGGVREEYFAGAPIELHVDDGAPVAGRVLEPVEGSANVFRTFLAELAEPCDQVRPGQIATWAVGPSEVMDGRLHAPACDDLAAVSAALEAMERLHQRREAGQRVLDVRLLFTRAEEVGFVGAIAACRAGTIPRGARLIALENSRSFADSPIGGGPIVRVGDRLSVFSPGLTAAVSACAEALGGPVHPAVTASVTARPWRWQRKLMPGGACEASVFCAFGYEATCLCLPLGNYHNMADLDAVQAGTHTGPARLAREVIALADYDGLVDLLVACGEQLDDAPALGQRFDALWAERAFVLEPSS